MYVTNQNNRLLSIDLARGLAVFFMFAVHTMVVFASPEVKNSLFGQIIWFFAGPPGTPVFMAVMGFSFVYSRKSELKTKLWRGFKIFLSGYLLNILRGVIPYKLSYYFEIDLSNKFPIDKLNAYTILTIVDILQFAGIALIIMAIIQEFKINKFIILITAFLITMVSPLLWGLQTNISIVDFFLDLLWGVQPIDIRFIGNKIAFPVFPWLTFPLLGMFLGETMKTSKDQSSTFKYFGIGGILVLFIGILVSSFDIDYHFNDYYHSRQGAMIFMCGFVVFWLFLNQIAIEKIPRNKLFDLLFKWSRGVTNIYFVQWIIIFWSIGFLGLNRSSFVETIALILTVSLISHFINEFILYIQQKSKQKQIN